MYILLEFTCIVLGKSSLSSSSPSPSDRRNECTWLSSQVRIYTLHFQIHQLFWKTASGQLGYVAYLGHQLLRGDRPKKSWRKKVIIHAETFVVWKERILCISSEFSLLLRESFHVPATSHAVVLHHLHPCAVGMTNEENDLFLPTCIINNTTPM